MLDLSTAADQLKYVDPLILKQAWAITDREGGFVNDPNDPGGATQYGISLRFAQTETYVGEDGNTYKTFDLNNDGAVDIHDIQEITPEMAVATYLIVFFMQPGLNSLVACLKPAAFDTSVNGGASRAIRLTQLTVNSLINRNAALNKVKPVTVDGKMGAETATALIKCSSIVSEANIVNCFCDRRVADYQAIVASNPQEAKFLDGWLTRANSFRIS